MTVIFILWCALAFLWTTAIILVLEGAVAAAAFAAAVYTFTIVLIAVGLWSKVRKDRKVRTRKRKQLEAQLTASGKFCPGCQVWIEHWSEHVSQVHSPRPIGADDLI